MSLEQEPPHYRGFFGLRAKGWVSTYLDRGSHRFLAVAGIGARRLVVSALFSYTGDQSSSVALVTPTGQHRFRRLFITTGFPYFSLSATAKGVYKCLHLFAGRVRLGADNHLMMRHGGDDQTQFDLCTVAAIDDAETLSDIGAVEARIADLSAATADHDRHQLAVLDHSLRCLEKQAKDDSSLHRLRAARIALSARFLVNHRTSHKALKLWVNAEKQQGRTEAAAAFVAEIARLTYPLALGRHGYNPSFANLDLDEVAKELHRLMAHVTEFGGQPFLNSGTLLGYYRDGRPIVHDDDFDLGIWLQGDTEAEVFANWHRFVARVRQHYTVINKGSFLSVRMSNGVQVDMFAAWTLRGRASVFPYCFEEVEAAALMPLGTLEIAGLTFAAPADPEALLVVNYGPNWRVPDPFWRFDYRKAKRRFGPAMKAMKSVN